MGRALPQNLIVGRRACGGKEGNAPQNLIINAPESSFLAPEILIGKGCFSPHPSQEFPQFSFLSCKPLIYQFDRP